MIRLYSSRSNDRAGTKYRHSLRDEVLEKTQTQKITRTREILWGKKKAGNRKTTKTQENNAKDDNKKEDKDVQ